MRAQKIRRSMGQLLVVGVLAVAVLVGSMAMSQPATAASRNEACQQLRNRAAMYSVIGDLYYLSGDYLNSAIYDSKATAYYEAYVLVC